MTDTDDDLLARLAQYRDDESEDHARLIQDTLTTLTRLMAEKERLGFKNSAGHEKIKAGLERATLAMRPTLH